MTDLLYLLLKCLLVGIIWATFLLPVIFRHGSLIKYILCVVIVGLLCYFFRGYAYMINQMTIVSLVALVLSWITSMAFFSKEANIKSKVIAFTSIISGLSYLVATLFVHITIF